MSFFATEEAQGLAVLVAERGGCEVCALRVTCPGWSAYSSLESLRGDFEAVVASKEGLRRKGTCPLCLGVLQNVERQASLLNEKCSDAKSVRLALSAPMAFLVRDAAIGHLAGRKPHSVKDVFRIILNDSLRATGEVRRCFFAESGGLSL